MDYLVYEYGCLPPVNGREAALEQMRRRHRLWNSLVEVERDYRSRIAAVLRDESTEQRSGMRRATGWPRCAPKSMRAGARSENAAWMLPTCKHKSPRENRSSAAARSRQLERAGAHASRNRKHSLDLLETARRVAVKQAQADSDFVLV